MNEITGVAFPVSKRYTNRFFDDGRTVFIKPATLFKKLRRGMKLVLYQSHEDTGYVGEARIKRIIIMDDPLAFFDTFGDAVFLTKEEVTAYVEDRERLQGQRAKRRGAKKKAWIALELEDIRRYETIRKPDRFVPAGGKYLRE
ncbi:MAG: hypothetical protein PWP08_784 [Methanofollis sp.]|nr:hypothetical protein [Methanofollis sp.]